ncbi:hypothetical protein [Janthinobacterium sp. PC23-8]|uniref:hypothetical protein n=1 Tax=Janthinobacterium sp. PC23-8 TaxID=2012679 RepID=UPI000B96B29D|nr:hypothetical protein [Janthinobacterium sp. PC23-8]OYO27879.1 hypothetical protein CD932_22460 [Janthinobacterium sp. PC23-8]
MATVQEKIAQAKAAGYSDADIASHLAATPEYGEKIKAATSAGYKPEEIVSHLGGAQPAAAAPVAAQEKGGGFLDGVTAAAAGAGTSTGRFVLGAQRLVGKGLAGIDGGAPGAPNSFVGRAGNWLVKDAEAGRARLAADMAPYKEKNPLSAMAGEVSGDILASLPVGGALVKGGAKLMQMAGITQQAGKVIGALPRAAQAAGVGAAYGGVMGAANSNADTFAGSLGDAAASAATSAAFGGLSSPVVSGLGAIARNVKGRVSETAAAEYAKQKVAQAFARDATGDLYTGGVLNPLSQIANRFSKLGPEGRIVDAGSSNTQQLLDTMAILPGRTKEAVKVAQRQRMATEGDRLRTSAEGALDTAGQRLPTTVDSLIARRTLDSAPLYAELRRTDIVPSQSLKDLMKNADELGVTKLGKEIATARQLPFTIDTSPAKWNMGDLDHVKQGIDQVLSSRKAVLADGTMTPLGRAYMELKDDLLKHLDSATTNATTGQSLYANARRAYAGPSQLIDAANAGKRAINQDEASINSVIRGMSDNEKQAFRIGAFEGLRGKLGMQGGRTDIMSMWKNQTTRERLKPIFGTERAFREFTSDVYREQKFRQLQGIGAGSKTAERLGAMADLDVSAVKDAAGTVAGLKTGNILAAAGSAKNAWNRVATPEAVRNQMGQMLLSRGPGAQREMNALAALVQQINDKNLQLSTRVGVLGGAAGANSLPPLVPVQIPQQ